MPRNEIKNTEADFLFKFDSWATDEKKQRLFGFVRICNIVGTVCRSIYTGR